MNGFIPTGNHVSFLFFDLTKASFSSKERERKKKKKKNIVTGLHIKTEPNKIKSTKKIRISRKFRCQNNIQHFHRLCTNFRKRRKISN